MSKIAVLGADTVLGCAMCKKYWELLSQVISPDERLIKRWEMHNEKIEVAQVALADLGLLVRRLQGCSVVLLLDIQDPRATLRVIDAMALLDKQHLITITPALQRFLVIHDQQDNNLYINPRINNRNIDMSYQLLQESTLEINPIGYPENCQRNKDEVIAVIGQRFIAKTLDRMDNCGA